MPAEPLRIAHVCSAPGWGGMEARTIETALWQAEQGHDVLVAAPRDSAIASMAARRGLKAAHIEFASRAKFKELSALRRVLQAQGTDVADFHTNRSFALGVQDLCALVRSRHNLMRRPAGWLRLPRTYPFQHVICTSHAARVQLIHRGSCKPDQVSVVGEWAEDRFFTPLASPRRIAELRYRLGLPAHGHVIGACAMVRPDNDFDALIRATASLRANGLALHCLVVGAPGDGQKSAGLNNLRVLATGLGVSDRTHFLGFRSDVPELLDVMDVVTVVSRHTAQTRVAPEAAARGKPVVGFSVGALGETVIDASTGRLVPLDDTKAFSRAIGDLLTDSAQRERLSTGAIEHAQLNFRQRPPMEATLRAYRQAVAMRVRRHAAKPEEKSLSTRSFTRRG